MISYKNIGLKKKYSKDRQERKAMKAIEIKGLTKYYGKNRGITELDLTVEQGDFFGFIGPNGAGKSTTIRAVLGLITPNAGSASLLGMKCQRSQTDILKKIGYMPSEAFFYSRMKVGEVIRLAADYHRKDCRKQAAWLCERLLLDTDKRVEELSLGNRKKVSIVCAMQHEPDLYILDEPTSGLDPLMQQEFFHILQEKNKKGATVFLSSHVLGEIQKYCRHAGILREGKLIRVSSVEEMAKSSAKRVTFTTAEGTESYLYRGNIQDLLETLRQKELSDLTITEPTLDEIVMHYYDKEENTGSSACSR